MLGDGKMEFGTKRKLFLGDGTTTLLHNTSVTGALSATSLLRRRVRARHWNEEQFSNAELDDAEIEDGEIVDGELEDGEIEEGEIVEGELKDGEPEEEKGEPSSTPGTRKLREERDEEIRLRLIQRKKDFVCKERIRGLSVNVAEGLELHTKVFSKVEQDRLINLVYEYQQKGRDGLLRDRTYSEPRKWMPGKGRVTIQFGCCYNYAKDKKGNRPGIMREEVVDPLPPLLKETIRRLVKWHVLPQTCVPDSCIINIYDVGDCIPPHIDHHDFLRPFCTLSLLSECSIVFGSTLEIVDAGAFRGPLSIPLPVGSVLVLNGKGADVAKHAVPGVRTSRISITFRKMDPARVPQGYQLPKDLRGITARPRLT